MSSVGFCAGCTFDKIEGDERAALRWPLPEGFLVVQVQLKADSSVKNLSILHQASGAIYRLEHPMHLSTIGFLLVPGTFLFSSIRVFWASIRLVSLVALDVLEVLKGFFKIFSAPSKGLNQTLLGSACLGKHIGQKVSDIFLTIFCTAPLALAFAFTVFFPFQGRVIAAKIEKVLNGSCSKFQDFRLSFSRKYPLSTQNYRGVFLQFFQFLRFSFMTLLSRDTKYTFYSARCFQPREGWEVS